MSRSDLIDHLRDLEVEPGEHLALAVDSTVGVGLALRGTSVWAGAEGEPMEQLATIDRELNPRWVWWDHSTARSIAGARITIDRCWDVLAVQRLVTGRWQCSAQTTWASLHRLPVDTIPRLGQLGLLDHDASARSDPDSPFEADGHLRPEWVDATWRSHPQNLATWALLANEAASLQTARLLTSADPARALSTAHAESLAALLCSELESDGLPIDEEAARAILAETVGPPTRTSREEDESRALRDARVLDLLVPRQDVNLRSSADVKAMLRRLDIDIADTRAWRLEQVRDAHPVVDALLHWRKTERIATTYGYRWLDENVRGGRLRGNWSSTDGSAGRMTASAGLHNLPADMRSAVVADPGHCFVRADLGQIEPRVLAAVSQDSAFAAATRHDDLYAEVAQQLGVEREIAKLAVLGAMYGATTGESAHALRRLEKTYPTAMQFLDSAARSGQERADLRTIGGRRIPLSAAARPDQEADLDVARSETAARGRYARNAVIQGAAAEFFKVWAIIVRRRMRPLDGRIVLCLHDELLVHVPAASATEASLHVADAVAEAAHFWSPSPDVRFVADVRVIERWSEAKD